MGSITKVEKKKGVFTSMRGEPKGPKKGILKLIHCRFSWTNILSLALIFSPCFGRGLENQLPGSLTLYVLTKIWQGLKLTAHLHSGSTAPYIDCTSQV